ncbi:MAG: DUF547 domain-containing protein [Candidatus Methylomirabilis sp.]|nr:DUF547 domain-containing protein [Deltaproteobacteria bacterium]
MSSDSVLANAQAAYDILRRARPREALKLLLPRQLRPPRVLNEGAPRSGDAAAPQVAELLRKITNRVKSEAIDAEKGVIDYKRLADSAAYRELQAAARTLTLLRPGDFRTDEERIAFWLNLYNVLVIHGIVAFGVQGSVMEIPTFFDRAAYRVGDWVFTPNEVEHGVLRRNRRDAITGRRSFRRDDPRAAFMPERLDPRVHMAMVCAARSCPPIAFYGPDRLDAQLSTASANFVEHDLEIDDARRVVRLSAIFKWYEEDFGGRPGLQKFLVRYAHDSDRGRLEEAFGDSYALAFRRYDWTLNAAS